MNPKLVEKVLENGKLSSNAESEKYIELVLNALIDILIEDRKIILYKKFSLKVKKKKEKIGINPKTRERVFIPEKNIIKFKASNHILERL